MGASGSRGSAAVNEIGNGLGLGEVKLAVAESTLREFSGKGGSDAETQNAGKQQVEHNRATVALKLEDGLPGEGSGVGKEYRQTAVDRLATFAPE